MQYEITEIIDHKLQKPRVVDNLNDCPYKTVGKHVNGKHVYVIKGKLDPKTIEYKSKIKTVNLKWHSLSDNGFAVITGCDSTQEEYIDWWLSHYYEHNNHFLYFIDFGLTEERVQKLKDIGVEVIQNIPAEHKSLHAWYRKAIGILSCRHKNIVWVDLDCQIQGDLIEIEAQEDKVYVKNGHSGIKNDIEYVIQAGVISFKHGNKIILDWAKVCSLGNKSVSLFKDSHSLKDENILNYVLGLNPDDRGYLDESFNYWQYEYVGRDKGNNSWCDRNDILYNGNGKDAKVIHYCGKFNKKALKEQTSIITDKKIKELENKRQIFEWEKLKYPNQNCIIGATDAGQEWMIETWVNSIRQSKVDANILFIDFGVSKDIKHWLIKNDVEVKELKIGEYHPMYYKPQTVLKSSYENNLWLDMDCQVIGDLSGAFGTETMRFRKDHMQCLTTHEWWHPQAGVFGCKHGSQMVLDWAAWCSLGNDTIQLVKDPIKLRDQQVMAWMIHELGYKYDYLDHKYNWMIFELSEKEFPADVNVIHWAGPYGKEQYKSYLKEINYDLR